MVGGPALQPVGGYWCYEYLRGLWLAVIFLSDGPGCEIHPAFVYVLKNGNEY